jgi:hypothetical protein
MKYWIFGLEGGAGGYSAEEAAAQPGVTMTTLVCPASGEILEKNWRCAGEFFDLAEAIAARDAAQKPPPPLAHYAELAAKLDAGAMTAAADASGRRLFGHIADMMGELGSRREEKELVRSLQDQISRLKNELALTRDRADRLETRLLRIAELEDRARKDQALLASLQARLRLPPSPPAS